MFYCIYVYIFVYFIHYTFLFVLCTICFDWPEEKAIQNFNLHVYNDNKGEFYSILGALKIVPK